MKKSEIVSKYKRYDKSFEGSAIDLKKDYEDTYLDTIDNCFGDIENLKVGEMLDDVMGIATIKRKSESVYVLYTMTIEALINERGFKPLKYIGTDK